MLWKPDGFLTGLAGVHREEPAVRDQDIVGVEEDVNACVEGCVEDADCPRDMGLFFVCNQETHQCEVPLCEDFGEPCMAGEESVCAPLNYDDPEEIAYCLATCDAHFPAECGDNGNCDWWPIAEDRLDFVCRPAGAAGEFELCEEERCAQGLSCLPFDDGEGGTVWACAYYCTPQLNDCGGENLCNGMENWGFPEDLGVCLPPQEG